MVISDGIEDLPARSMTSAGSGTIFTAAVAVTQITASSVVQNNFPNFISVVLLIYLRIKIHIHGGRNFHSDGCIGIALQCKDNTII